MRCSNFTTPSRTSEEDSHLSKNSGKMVENKFLSFGIMQGLSLRDHTLKSDQFETSISIDILNVNKGGISPEIYRSQNFSFCLLDKILGFSLA